MESLYQSVTQHQHIFQCPLHHQQTRGKCRQPIRPAPGEVDLQRKRPKKYNTGVTSQVLSKSSYLELGLELQNASKRNHSQEREESSPMTVHS